MNTEEEHIKEKENSKSLCLKWSLYLSEYQWGTVREDYRADGNAWEYITHEKRGVMPMDGVRRG